MAGTVQSDVLIIGGGLAGLVTALECLRAGQRVTLVDRDTPERLGGLALWAFGGMALVDTPLQRRMKLKDSPTLPCATGFASVNSASRMCCPAVGALLRRTLARRGLRLADRLRPEVHAGGELGRARPAGQRQHLPRYHIVWGTSRHMTLRMIELAREAGSGGRLTLLSRHRVTALEGAGGRERRACDQ
jgi:predicted oxidoreductase